MSVYGQVDREHILHVILYLTGVDSIVRSPFAVEYGGYKGLIKVTTVYQITWHKRVK